MADHETAGDGPSLTVLGKLIILLIIGGCFYGAYALLLKAPPANSGMTSNGGQRPESNTSGAPGPNATQPPPSQASTAEIGIAYGTEKKSWLTWALAEFQKTLQGSRIKLSLIPMGSLEGGQAAVAGDKRIHVWSPASAIYKDTFVVDWEAKHGSNPILREDVLALSPMVFVMWEERYQGFIKKYQEVNFKTLGLALQEKGGWNAIAGKAEWGLFKAGHTHPNLSNSGMVTLALMANDYHGKNRGLELKDVLDTGFQNWMQEFERGVSGLSNSTGNMMKEMVLKGPSSFDVVIVYENVAIDYLKGAQGRWGDLRVIYPKMNMWNDNPYYILNAPWSSSEQREAAGVFLDFLMSEPIQRQALEHGFRPGNPQVPVNQAESPFMLLKKYGLQLEIPAVCEPPKSEVVYNLLSSWQRSQGKR